LTLIMWTNNKFYNLFYHSCYSFKYIPKPCISNQRTSHLVSYLVDYLTVARYFA
jgi:retron-type reverse transcriptase